MTSAGNAAATADMKLEVVVIPVSDVDHAKRFYAASYSSLASFGDPDGNGWLPQEIATRLAGRVDVDTTFTSSGELSQALRRAAAAHGEHQKRIGGHDDNWPDWYADNIVREQAGEKLPE